MVEGPRTDQERQRGHPHGRISVRGRERPLPASVRIRDELRGAIASLRLRPGAAILEKDLAQLYGVSRTPVREALAKLAQEGLVSVFPQAGTFVARIPFCDLPEALVIRRSLEETSARLAAAQGVDADVATAAPAALADARAAASAGDEDTFHAADEAFHAAVAEVAGYPGLWHVVRQVKIQVDRFRRLTLPQAGRFSRVLDEHDAILRAIQARDPDAAAAAMGLHIGGLLADLDAIARAHPDSFDMAPRVERAAVSHTDTRRNP